MYPKIASALPRTSGGAVIPTDTTRKSTLFGNQLPSLSLPQVKYIFFKVTESRIRVDRFVFGEPMHSLPISTRTYEPTSLELSDNEATFEMIIKALQGGVHYCQLTSCLYDNIWVPYSLESRAANRPTNHLAFPLVALGER
jgi:hypothetical protein